MLRIVICAILLMAAFGYPASAQSVWELSPYRIQLITAMQPAAGLDARLQSDLEAALLSRFETVVGAAWNVSTAKPAPRLRHQMIGDLGAVSAEIMPEDLDELDKVMLLAVTNGPAGYRVSAREYDVRTQLFGPVAEKHVAQPAKLCSAAFDAVWDAFVPLARIVSSKSKDVNLRLRAGGLSMRDKSLKTLKLGEIFRPIVRYLDREGKIRRVMEVPWTFMVVDKIEDRGFHCKLHSAMHSPLTGRRRGRVEQLALAVRPGGESTSLTLIARTEPKHPLGGYDIYSRLPDSKKTTPVGRTDENGTVEIPANDRLLRVFEVKCGGVLLARLPIVPGLGKSLTAEVPDVDKRLEMQGFITGIQEVLVDIVTRREVLIARARRHVDAAEWDKAKACVAELRSLQTRAEFLRTLDKQQESVDVKDNWTKKKIDKLFLDTRGLLDKFLDPETINKIDVEVSTAQRENRAPKSPAATPAEKTSAKTDEKPAEKPAEKKAQTPPAKPADPFAEPSAPPATEPKTPPAAGKKDADLDDAFE